MHQPDLLPGALGPESAPVASGYRPHDFIRSARRRAAMRQWADGAMLLLLDAFVMQWHEARLPFTSREMSVTLLAVANAAFLAWYLVSRKFPEWHARRVAASWCPDERRRLHGRQEKMQAQSRSTIG